MAYQRRRKRSLQFEFLEKRETPSSIAGEPFGIHALGNGSGGSPIDFQGTYDITGGTGAVARATGGGAVTGIVTPKTLSLTFNLQGSIWP